MNRGIVVLILVLSCFSARTEHLVGGEIYYTCMGNNDYQITLVIYRDCFSTGAGFDPDATVTIFDKDDNIIRNLNIPILDSYELPLVAPNDCSTIDNVACTQKGIYKYTINLPPIEGGYVITHQRCCRNSTIANIPTPALWGNTYTTSVPSNDIACNSTPAFDSVPPMALCHNQQFRLDMSATELDGDSLHYELCEILHGGGQDNGTGSTSPAPSVSLPPPYTIIPFGSGHTFDNPITSNPAITINPNTGVINGRPTNIGQYVFAICVSEYRNGQFISKIRRDFQFNVTGSCTGVISLAETQETDPSTLCVGKTIQFTNMSIRASSYFWDFGDPATNGDTSRARHPSYTYSDTGTYHVTLVADPGSECADTNSWFFRVYDDVEFHFTHHGSLCFEEHSFDFEVENEYSPSADYEWDFGTNTNHGRNSNARSPEDIRFPQAGSYTVSLKIRDKECEGTYQDVIEVYPNPELSHRAPSGEFCLPVSLEFTDNSITSGDVDHYWDFGDGHNSRQEDPVHKYTEPGIFWVKHSLVTNEGCMDSLYERFPVPIEIQPKPGAQIIANPDFLPIYEPITNISSRDTGASHTLTLISDGRSIDNLDEQFLTFEDTGVFYITHIAFNESGCSDTSRISINVQALLDIYIPNAFTPNRDGINDKFQLEISGIQKYYISIFNRWGQMVFESSDIRKSWNGEIMNNGKSVPQGIYTYRVIVESRQNQKEIEKYGTVQLIR